jgi:hypothetical protein
MVDEYTQGTVVIDMMDARAKQTVWRAWAKDKGDDPVEAMNEKNLRKIVDKAFRKFPRKKG